MKILTYDEVDHDQVFHLHMSAFGDTLDEARVRTMIKRDRRVPDYFALYAIEGKEVLGLVCPWRIETRTREGVESVLGFDDIATKVDRARSGIATSLMQRAEEMAVGEGVRFSWLVTSAHLVAHNLYVKRGYFEATCIPHSLKRIDSRKKRPRSLTLRPYRSSDGSALDRLHQKYVRDGLGFTERQERTIDVRLATRHLSRNQVKVAVRSRKIVGYLVLRMQEKTPNVREIVAPAERNFKGMLAGIEAASSSGYAMAWCIFPERQRARFWRAGYPVSETDWWRILARPLDRNISIEEMRHLYGLDDGSFTMMGLDVF